MKTVSVAEVSLRGENGSPFQFAFVIAITSGRCRLPVSVVSEPQLR